MILKVTEGDSVFDATAPGGLQISQNEPLLWWSNRYDEYHGISAPIPMRTEVDWTRNSLEVDYLTIACHRTLRVPDSNEANQLPPVRPTDALRVARNQFLTPIIALPGYGLLPTIPCRSTWIKGS